ncbi:NADH dependent flavin oxidoreductase [Mycoplasmopsis californica HAZ160_1]|uniref:NADH dependent flavin oxidoreductase n=1 Tax=Mycoplasmopsis californica HAZ160_1 TaxID=1397850 RepID=A0AAT9F8H6_9BACT|nr:NADH-dependent flavin oxidoreductase [Mycoplasmopsis californica]BAP01164.1 NADH dependent flavin oxidoreductase [Mycoplasmopsis californica HAZ160_1]BBG41031.1 NADH dependent flavin oxidoreductase [Mycoplasmopsis californica]BBG41624.1 NADH dependent flavin oxidoreductase [Mycoplasmopsis californica]BBG42218.1 NADH dependent flavin oxidoreductase [Mycoplasmopsis californica]BBG42799.1 NADH dependent flavin oxidoreductase [Mycoplasmopsis californica]
MNKYLELFKPFKLGKYTLQNRFVLSPMTLSLTTIDGKMTDQEANYTRRRANSAPLIVSGAAYIDDFGQLFEYGYSAKSDSDIDSLARLAQAMKADGNIAILQLAHAGKFSKASLKRYGHLHGPSYEKNFFPVEHEVFELTQQQIKNIIKDYAKATQRAIKAGFDGIEISMAQRLLIQTFFSKIVNKRTDSYGTDTFENRSRLCIEVVQAIRNVIDQFAPEGFLFGFRATPEETYGPVLGYTIEEFNQLIDLTIEKGKIDYLAIASWGHDIYLNKVRSDCKFKGQLVNEVIYNHFKNRVAVIASGGINTPDKCLDALQHCDLVGLSSVFVADPEFVHKIKNNEIDKINLAIKPEQLNDLAIPEESFKGIVNMFGYCETIPNQAMSTLTKNSINKTKSHN